MTDDGLDSQVAYDLVRSFVSRRTVAHAEQRAVREQELKVSLCAHGELSAEEANTALRALDEQGEIIRGDGWTTIDCESDDWYRQVIEWCAERDDPPRALIGACNRRLNA